MRAVFILCAMLWAWVPLTALGDNFESNFDDVDKRLIQAFNKRCDNARFTPLGFPSLSYSKDSLISCEISKFFDPQKYELIHAKLLHAYANHNSVFSSTATRAISTIDQHFSITEKDTDVDKLLKGDFRAIGLFNNKQTNGDDFVGLPDDKLQQLSEVFGHLNTLLLYAPDTVLFEKIDTWQRLDEVVSHLFKEAKHLDPTNLNRAIERLNDAIVSLVLQNDPNASFMSGALLIPTGTRKKILSLSAISPYFYVQLIDEIRRIEYSEMDLISHNKTGSDRQMFDFDFEETDINIFWAVSNLEAAEGAVFKMSITDSLQYLNYWKQVAPENYSKIVEFFSPKIQNLLRVSNYEVLKNYLSKLDILKPGSVGTPYDQLIKYQLQFLILNPERREQSDNQLIDSLPKIWFDHALEAESKITKLIISQKLSDLDDKPSEKFFDIAKSVTSLQDLCGDINPDNCKKLVREINLDLIFENEFELGTVAPKDSKLTSVSTAMDKAAAQNGITSFFRCKITDLGIIWAKIGFAGHFIPSEMVSWCPFFQIADFLDEPTLNHSDLILKAAAFPATTGISFLSKQSFWSDQSTALLPLHLSTLR